MKKDIFFQQFCQTLTSPSRDMYSWILTDLQETWMMNTYNWEISASHGIQFPRKTEVKL